MPFDGGGSGLHRLGLVDSEDLDGRAGKPGVLAADLALAAQHLELVAGPGPVDGVIHDDGLAGEDDLIVALQDGLIAGAALDVFCQEPLPTESKFWELENVLLSPHNADQTIDYRHKSVQFFCENCARFISGTPLRNVISAVDGY